MRQLLVATALLVMIAATPAQAWRGNGRIWDLDDMPVVWYAPDPAVGDVASMPSGAAVEIIPDALQSWADVPCSPLEAEFGGFSEDNHGDPAGDYVNQFFWDDHNDELGSGILAACWSWYTTSTILTSNGVDYYRLTDFDIVSNDGVNYGTPEDIHSGDCASQYSFLGVMTHELGHGFGLGHSCESDEACPDPLLREATMYWSTPACATLQEEPNEDDIAGVNALYGVYTEFDATTETSGAVPLQVSFEVPEELSVGLLTYSWTFGDGAETSDEVAPTHVYQAEGQYTVSLSVTGTNDECGEFENSVRRMGYVLACGPPEPDFEITNIGEGMVQFDNTTPTTTFGCVHEYAWDLGDGTEVAGYEPQHDYGEAGSWTVKLTASGPGGANTVEKSVDVQQSADPRQDEPLLCGIGATPAPSTKWTIAAILGLAFWLRRR
jgi:chitodextrinase